MELTADLSVYKVKTDPDGWNRRIVHREITFTSMRDLLRTLDSEYPAGEYTYKIQNIRGTDE